MAMAAVPNGYQTANYTAKKSYTTGRSPVMGSQNGITVAIEKSPNWDKVANRYKNYHGSDELKRTGLIKWAMAEGVKVWQSQADIQIYKAPLPKSAADDPNYLMHARTGRTREAIMQAPSILSGLPGDSGAVVLNKSRFPGFYYALTQEYGSTKMAYRAMHMLANTKAIMRPRFSAQGRQARHDLGLNLRVS
jgi:hypothetical protein